MILLEADPSPVYALAYSPDGAQLIAGTRRGGLSFFHHLSAAPEPPAQLLETPVNAVAFSPSGDRVAAATGLGWFARSGAGLIARPKFPSRSVTGVKFLTETLLAVGLGDRSRAGAGQVELWDVDRNKAREPKLTAPEGIRALDASPIHKRLAWVEWGRRLGVWDTESATPRTIPLAQTPMAIVLSPAADRAAVAMQWVATVYDLTKKQEQFTLKGHKGSVTALAWTPDDRSIITGSWDGSVKFWDATTAQESASYDFGVGRITALALSPDGLQLAIGGERGIICVFDVT